MLTILEEIEAKRPGTSAGIPRVECEALYNFIKEYKIKRVVETGVAYGLSTAYILAALPEDGKLISIEPVAAEYIGSVVPERLRDKWELALGTSKDLLPVVFKDHKNIDLFFHDSKHYPVDQTFEYEAALPFVKFVGSHDIRLYGPQFAWGTFIEKHKLEVLLTLGQLGFCRTGKKGKKANE